jgi:hypothetical protein
VQKGGYVENPHKKRLERFFFFARLYMMWALEQQ